MKQIKIEGGNTLTGSIRISGAKNSAVALVPAALLSDGVVTIDNIPDISDIDALNEILIYLGAKVVREGSVMTIDSSCVMNQEIPEEISNKLRASYYFMAALLGKYKKVEMYFPGGCNIGSRPIDQTLKAFRALGAMIEENDNKYVIAADELVGGNIYLDMPSVGATINTMIAAVKAKGITTINNCAKEPEIVSVATFLNNMGAKIIGAGTSQIMIDGVETLSGCFTEVIPDRIEAGTYLIVGALVGENLTITNVIPKHIEALTTKLIEMGFDLDIKTDTITISKTPDLKSVTVKTLGYPGFATDLQQPITPLLCMCKGTSVLEETIYENRFNNVQYLQKMGALIRVQGSKIYIQGPTNFIGAEVEATDLRAGACVILAGLAAEGTTTVTQVEHVLRGYENIIEKLREVGAKIELEEI